jgi:hypothetical protein
MPQAPSHLQAMFEDDRAAWNVLKDNFTDDRGVIRPKPGHVPSANEFNAVDYLCLEWDYCYEANSALAAGVGGRHGD